MTKFIAAIALTAVAVFVAFCGVWAVLATPAASAARGWVVYEWVLAVVLMALCPVVAAGYAWAAARVWVGKPII